MLGALYKLWCVEAGFGLRFIDQTTRFARYPRSASKKKIRELLFKNTSKEGVGV